MPTRCSQVRLHIGDITTGKTDPRRQWKHQQIYQGKIWQVLRVHELCWIPTYCIRGAGAQIQVSWCWRMGISASKSFCPRKRTLSIMAFSYRPVLSQPLWQAHLKAEAYRMYRHSQDCSTRSQRASLYWSCCWQHRGGHGHWGRAGNVGSGGRAYSQARVANDFS